MYHFDIQFPFSLLQAGVIFTVLKHKASLEAICADCRFYPGEVYAKEPDFVSVSPEAAVTYVTVRGGEVGLWCIKAGCLEHDSLLVIELSDFFFDHLIFPSYA